MKSVVDQPYWDNTYRNYELQYDESLILFKDLFQKYLQINGKCIEIGCYPGNYLIYLGKTFNYEVSGIDITPYIERLDPYFQKNEVKIGKLFLEDFLTFSTNEKYDVVCSFGFIEHFKNIDEIIDKHISLLKTSGICIISSPNFRKIQFILHNLLDKQNMDRHVTASMDLNKWKEVLEQNDMEIIHSGYYKTASFWTDSSNQNLLQKYCSKIISSIFAYINKHIDYPNRYISPHMICISRKK
ncbi:MAG: hypothetical protein APR54_09810 [Candidatus Cloacimonas sp. SDB]|nr:MAG: hypothetical protein APR54_09810 [Candidatus Cloacimonas sp. SDB]